jgi:hypothetical protein
MKEKGDLNQKQQAFVKPKQTSLAQINHSFLFKNIILILKK